ncbi:MAG TPA: class I SAM-dependent methyltransferase [Anaerolineae bacterium]|nr:class I SAM-dependent methyltransferase [Anaerolineae bacterium]
MRLSDYPRFFTLASRRLRSPRDYRAFQAFQGQQLVAYLHNHIPGSLAEARVLDLGCSFGGYAAALAGGVHLAVGLDLRFSLPRPVVSGNLGFVCADAMQTPFDDRSFDLVICASLVEHVAQPLHLLSQIARLLRSGGWCYLSFPPYYSLRGGHGFSPFHLLGEPVALKVHGMLHPGHTVASYASAYGDCGLYKVTIHGVESLLGTLPFEIWDVSTRWPSLNTARWPWLNEFLTWHVQFLLRRKP